MKFWITASVSPEDAKLAPVKKDLMEILDGTLEKIGENKDITFKVVAGPEEGEN